MFDITSRPGKLGLYLPDEAHDVSFMKKVGTSKFT